MADYLGVTVDIRLSPDGTTYQVGTEINGAFQPFTFGGWPASNFEAYVADAKAKQDAEAAAQTAAQ